MQHAHVLVGQRSFAVAGNPLLELALKIGVPMGAAVITRDAKATAAAAARGFLLHMLQCSIAEQCPLCGLALQIVARTQYA
jgi:hypothetical protein